MNRTYLATARTAPRATAVAALAALLALGGTAAMAQTVHIVEPAAPMVQVMPAPTVQVMPAATIVAPSSGLARVVSATPNIERYVETRQQCTDQVQQVTTPGTAGLGSTIAGSLIGGAIASPIGKGAGKTVAIATGSAIGAHVARQAAASQTTTTTRTVQVCQPVNSVREQVRDYSVRYEWEGREHQVNLPQHPGAWLRVSSSHSVQTL
jgi:uncharacterized protein YcfJ